MTKTKSTWLRGSCIGRGAYGTVSAAVNTSTGDLFAVKSVDLSKATPSHAEALENEIAILKSLASPFIIRYLGDDTTAEGSPASSFRNLHLEYYPGGTAADLADSGEATVASYAWCVLSALSYLHNRGIVHCDVKGRNVLLGGSTGSAVLADFGSAAEVSSAAAAGRGSPLWMAPEVVRGEYQGPESDVWSLGCTVIEMLTAKPAWGAEAGSIYRIGYSDELPLFPARLSASGADFLEKCLRRDYAQRWSCDQLLQHPFVSMLPRKDTANHWSPRCVLDGFNFEFRDEEEEEGIDDGEVINSEDDERIRGLASEAGANWESEGWLVVRGESDGGGDGDGDGDGGGTCSEFTDLTEERMSGASSEFGATNLSNSNLDLSIGRIVNNQHFSPNNCSNNSRKDVKRLMWSNYGLVYDHLHIIFFNFTFLFLCIISRKWAFLLNLIY